MRQMRVSDGLDVWDDFEGMPVANLPAKFRMLDIERYTGIGCPRIHLRLYSHDVEDDISRGLWTDSSPSDVKGKKPFGGQRSFDGIERPPISYTTIGHPCYAAQFIARPTTSYPRPRAQRTSAPSALRTQRAWTRDRSLYRFEACHPGSDRPGFGALRAYHVKWDYEMDGATLGPQMPVSFGLVSQALHVDDSHTLDVQYILRGGRVLRQPPPAAARPVEGTSTPKEVRVEDYEILRQLQSTQAHISIWSLLASSSTHRDALIRALSQIRVKTTTFHEGLIHMMMVGRATCIVFSDDELPPEGSNHTRPLYTFVGCSSRRVPTVLLDNGSTLNVCPLATTIVLGYVPSNFSPSTQTVHLYDSTRREVVVVQSVGDMFIFAKPVLEISHTDDDIFSDWIHLDEVQTVEIEDFCRDFVTMFFDQHSSTVVLDMMQTDYFVRASELHAPSDGIIGGFNTTKEAELQHLVQYDIVDGAVLCDEMLALILSQIEEIVQPELTSPFNLFGVSFIKIAEEIQTAPAPEIAEDINLQVKEGDPEAAQCRIFVSGRVSGMAGQCRPCSQKGRQDLDGSRGHGEDVLPLPEWGTYCYRVMPFGLKNAGTTYQRAATILFHDMMHRDVEVYVDDMIVKSRDRPDHLAALERFFERIRQFKLRLNPKKCTFRVTSRKLLGYMVRERGIEVDPDKIRAILDMPASRTERECQRAFERIKEYLLSPPVLASPTLGKDQAIYYLSKRMLDYEARLTLIGRLMRWLVLLTKFDIHYVTQKSIRGSIIADHLASLLVSDGRAMMMTSPGEDVTVVTSLSERRNQFVDALANLASMIDIPADATIRHLLIETLAYILRSSTAKDKRTLRQLAARFLI
ncbi:Retrovirus-related Pol polyprotein from transposon 17.6 [Vitis vinifera]|uniref:Retrovirus-related Pol polyprotein from transposon 17.6 n=1 Tax=Vitis vinifera TaxID=29760 RepID=A0A438G2E0_VITVI|nr:Retrovirus-related Pol polyprotein from transposon 17.6 [Vitis vinifera]